RGHKTTNEIIFSISFVVFPLTPRAFGTHGRLRRAITLPRVPAGGFSRRGREDDLVFILSFPPAI
ncbi:MAG: hypothetical protein NT031_12470, partial [Planctomycetota bacterium]|nr:hypothetical protein [Planctomycetota bacterium]